MNDQFQVVFSNRVGELYQQLKRNLFNKEAPFARRLVIVSNPALKSWLMLQLAKDPEVGIGAGLEISYLDQTIQKLKFSQTSIPDAMELALAIEWEIRKILQNNPSPCWQPLLKYLQASANKPLSIKAEKRLVLLSEKLAKLFLEYGKYGGDAIQEWETAHSPTWQQELWDRLLNKGKYSYLYKELKKPRFFPVDHPLSVHLFSISFLPKLYGDFFSQFSESAPVFHYLLSPCQLFWSDIRSNKEIARLKHRVKDASIADEWEGYLRDSNPLLANLGKVGRKMAEQIEERGLTTTECYLLSEAHQEHPVYRDLIDPFTKIESTDAPLTMLQALQGDLLLLRNPNNGPKISFDRYDHSIQIHANTNRLREIESLHNTLLSLIDLSQDNDDQIAPEDIVVMAPNIADYEPYIKMVFDGSEGNLRGKIIDLHLPSQSLLVQGFLHLLSLPFGRWDVAALLQLFHYSAFQKKQGFTSEDLNTLEGWIKKTGVIWGQNQTHRGEILNRAHCFSPLEENASTGTWEFAIDQLIAGLIYDPSNEEGTTAPFDEIEFTQSELLGKFVRLLRSLHRDLSSLADGTQLKLQEWTQLLQNLFKTYFEPLDEEADEYQEIATLLLAFYHLSPSLPDARYSFLSIKKHLTDHLANTRTNYQDHSLSAARFCSILPMRTLPAKVVAWIGMEEGAFPRQEKRLSLNMLSKNPKADFIPSQTDFDRYLFLEGILSARQYFIMSHLNYSEEDSKETTPSLLLSELMNYLDNAYEVEGVLPTSKCYFKHPFYPFDSHYFSENSPFPSYSEKHYKMAKAFYHLDKQSISHFVPQFIAPLPSEEQETITLDTLVSFARNPLRTYYNQKLGIYLETKENRLDEKFQLTALDKYALKQDALKTPLNTLLNAFERKGGFPPSNYFKKLAKTNLCEEITSLKNKVGEEDSLFEIEISELHSHPHLSEKGNWLLPPLQIVHRNKKIKIVGRFEFVSKQGLILQLNTNKEDLVKAVPQVLVYQALLHTHAIPLGKDLIFSKEGKTKQFFHDNPLPLLDKFLEYYYLGIENPSPLLPEWVPTILVSNGEAIGKKIVEIGSNSFKKNYNEYSKWILKEGKFPYPETTLEEWKKIGNELFSEFYSHWSKQ